MDIVKIEGREVQLPLTVLPSTAHLITSIATGNTVALKQCASSLVVDGHVEYPMLFQIPSNNRIAALEKTIGEINIHKLIIVLLTKFQNVYNVPAKMNEEQIVECAYDIFLKSKEYHCAIEDLILFFERAKTSEYGKIYNRIDAPVVLELFDKYLDIRHHALYELKRQNQYQYEKKERDPVEERLSKFAGALGDFISKAKNLTGE